MSKTTKKILLIIFGIFIIVNFIPVDRSNPKVTNEIKVHKGIIKILKESCYDCHSNETKWPLYSYIAPASWIVSGHVANGRRHLNFSEWDESKALKMYEEIKHEIDENEMPLKSYTFLHSEAILSENDKNAIYDHVQFSLLGEK